MIKLKVLKKGEKSDVIRDWMKGFPKGAQAQIDVRLRHMETLERKEWVRPLAAKMRSADDIFEIRIKWQRNQYRPLGFFGPGESEFTMVIGAVEKDRKLEPHNAVETAEKKREQVLKGGGGLIDDYFKEP